MTDALFENSIKPGAGLQESVQTLFGPDTEVSVGTTSESAIPSAVWSRGRATDPASDQEAVLVRCGPQSKGLCALIFDEQEAVTGFMKANAISRRTLISRALSRELILWFRCDDWTSPNTTIGHMRWCSKGLIPVVSIDDNLESRILRRCPIATVQFGDFKWDSESERVFWISRLQALHGPAIRRVAPQKAILNEEIICRLFARAADVQFDVAGRRFLRGNESGELEYVADEDLLALLAAWLQQLAPLFGGDFPMNELRPPRLRSLFRHLKSVAVVSQPDPYDALVGYVKSRLTSKRGSNLTMQEIHLDYTRQQSGIASFPDCQFLKYLPPIVRQTFALVRAHNVQRWNQQQKKMTPRRGFNGLAFREEPDAADGADAFVSIATARSGASCLSQMPLPAENERFSGSNISAAVD